jgi:hypothetical protein
MSFRWTSKWNGTKTTIAYKKTGARKTRDEPWGSPEKVDSESGQKSLLVKKYGEAHYDKTKEAH